MQGCRPAQPPVDIQPVYGLAVSSSRHFRQHTGEEQRATWLELFFDLVFVFAVTQLSHLLLRHLTVDGALQTLFLLLVVWWAWIYTAWMTNWFDPESVLVRLVLLVVMAASLLMAVAIPQAFGTLAPLFACSYVALQVVRNAFNVYATPPDNQFDIVFRRILVWSVASGVLWVVGGFASHDARIVLWIAALAVDYVAPSLGYWTPRLGRSATTDWEIEEAHFAERFQLFIIIALGESIVVTGATASSSEFDPAIGTSLMVAFATSAALWWLYFDEVGWRAQRFLSQAGDSGRLARDAYTYLHTPIVAGIIVAAVADEIVIAAPGASPSNVELAVILGGPVIYLIGHTLFRLRMIHNVSRKRVVAAIAIVAMAPLGAVLPSLAIASCVLAILTVLAVAETRNRLAESAALLAS
jgi:low temperature requirement protein LtrA